MPFPIVRNYSRGFTLIELFVTIAVIVILAGIAYPTYTTMQERAWVTHDLNNLRQIGIATQLYLNDNDGVLFTAGGNWMTQLKPKYIPAWKIFRSPFDKRDASEIDASAPISYGLNGNPTGSSIAGLSMDKIANPSVFILFAPAPDSTAGDRPMFQGVPTAAVTEYKGTSVPGGPAPTPDGGTHNKRKQINALFADLHTESMLWSKFILDTDPSDSSASQRWTPYPGYPP